MKGFFTTLYNLCSTVNLEQSTPSQELELYNNIIKGLKNHFSIKYEITLDQVFCNYIIQELQSKLSVTKISQHTFEKMLSAFITDCKSTNVNDFIQYLEKNTDEHHSPIIKIPPPPEEPIPYQTSLSGTEYTHHIITYY